MAKEYIKLQNQGSILANLKLLNEMRNSVGYSDENGYFTKKAMAEVGINSFTITSGGKMGKAIIDLVNDSGDELKNPVLQQAKMRMQILRVLGLVSTDYDSEIYAITDLGEKVLERAFPASIEVIPDYSLLMEAFMGITTSSETYNHNCAPDFNCYLGYNIGYAMTKLDYMISVDEMPILTTYSIEEIENFVDDAKRYRSNKQSFPTTHEHFPKTQSGKPVAEDTRTNITRTINQILRLCGIIEQKKKRINGINYYVCTPKGKEYFMNVMKGFKSSRFITPYYFRRSRIVDQKNICTQGYNNMLDRGGYKVNSTDKKIVFSPYQLILESDADRLLNNTSRKPPNQKKDKLDEVSNCSISTGIRLKPTYLTQNDYDNFIKTHISKNNIITEIINERENYASSTLSDDERKKNLINELVERHKSDDKSVFYPFVHSLFMAMGMDCKGEVGRIDGLFVFDGILIPAEIKSFTEVQAYNLKGARQALENKILLFEDSKDLEWASLLVGYLHPTNVSDVERLINAAYEEWGVKIIAFDLRTIVTMCVNSVWDKQKVDFSTLLKRYGIAGL